MKTIGRYPDVSIGQELLAVSRTIFADPSERIIADRSYPKMPYAWLSPATYEPQLKIIAPKLERLGRGGAKINHAVMILIEGDTSFELIVNHDALDGIKPDEFTIDFLNAFRQYEPHPLTISIEEREIGLKLIGEKV